MKRPAPPGLALVLSLALLAKTTSVVAQSSTAQQAGPQASPRFPHVLVITVDTLRPDRLSGYGYGRPTSPHIDRLMAAGVRATQARCVEPLTGPSLTSMLTALEPHDHGATRNGLAPRPGLPSLPKILDRRGFKTAALVSNWTLRHRLSGLGEHFEEYEEIFTRKRWFGLSNSEATGDDVSESAIAWLERFAASKAKVPFFLWVHYVEPHAPYRFHREHAAALGLPVRGEPPRSDRYDTEVAFVDAAIGRLLARLERLVPSQQVLIVFAADHGENLGEHGYWGHGRFLWEENLKIPLAITWPGRIPPGLLEAPVSNLDLAPTLLGLIGLPVPETFRGFDWSPVLVGKAAPPAERVTFHQAHKGAVLGSQDSEKVRRRGLLEVARVDASGKKEIFRVKAGERRTALYDLSLDRRELASLCLPSAAPSPELAAWLGEVTNGLEAADDLPPPSLDAESQEQLRSLGYLD